MKIRKYLKSIPSYIKKHLKNISLLIFGFFLFTLSCWQLDILCAPIIWSLPNIVLEIFPYVYMTMQHFYCLCFIGLFCSLPLIFIALWYWSD